MTDFLSYQIIIVKVYRFPQKITEHAEKPCGPVTEEMNRNRPCGSPDPGLDLDKVYISCLKHVQGAKGNN